MTPQNDADDRRATRTDLTGISLLPQWAAVRRRAGRACEVVRTLATDSESAQSSYRKPSFSVT